MRSGFTSVMRDGALMRAVIREFDPRKFLRASVAAARGICKDRFETFGCAGRSSRIKPIALETMAQRYAEGSLSGAASDGALAA
jgi:fructose-bisphosphate aldolase class II